MSTPRVAFGATPLKGGNTSGPAEPVPRCFWMWHGAPTTQQLETWA
jgi:hypothetical protein